MLGSIILNYILQLIFILLQFFVVSVFALFISICIILNIFGRKYEYGYENFKKEKIEQIWFHLIASERKVELYFVKNV